MRNKSAVLGLWCLLLIASLAIISRTSFRTDMGAFLPRSAPLAQKTLTTQVTSGAASHLILVALTGAPPPTLAALSESLATRLRAQPAFIDILNGDDVSFAATQKFIWTNRYLLSPDITAARFTTAGLHTALTSDLALLGSDLAPLVQQSLPSDPTAEVTALLDQFAPAGTPQSLDNVWFSQDFSRALLLVHTTAPGFDIDAQQRALTLITKTFSDAQNSIPNAATARLKTTGPGIFAVHTQITTKHDVTRLSILATLGAVILLTFAYRSPRVLLLGLLPVASGALVAVAAVSLAFGFVHGITLGFGVTLIGESLDYAIYLFTQTRRGDAAHDTLTRIWPTLRLGVLTSAAGFCAMLFSSFIGFAQLGLFSITGLIVAAGVTRCVLPHLVPVGFFAPGADFLAIPLSRLIRRRRPLRWLLAAALLASSVALLSHRGGLWNKNISDLSPIPAADQALDDTLRHDLAVPDTRYFAVFFAATKQQALQTSERLSATLTAAVAQKNLGGFDVPSRILPSDQTQTARRTALPDAATLATSLTQADASLPFRPGTFAPFLQDVAAAKTAPLLTPARLPPELALQLDSMLTTQNHGWVVMAPLREVKNPAAVAGMIAAAGLPATFVDLNQESTGLLHRFQFEAVVLAVTGTCAILLLLLAGLRAPARVLSVAAPLACAVLITAAALTLGGAGISIFMVVGFLLIVAVGSNYCLFFANHAADPAARQRTLASILLANLCTVAAYGLMATSQIPVLHDIGKTVALGTFLSLLCAAILSRPGADA